MTLSIRGLRPAELKALDKQAKGVGKTAEQYVIEMIKRELIASKTLDEILAPIRQGFKKSGVTEEELDAIVDRARTDIYLRDRRRRRRK